MKNTPFRIAFLSLAAALLLCVTGCGTVKSVYNYLDKPEVTPLGRTKADKSGLKKKVLVLPFLNQGELPEKRFDEISSAFLSLLEKDDRILLHVSRDPIPSTLKVRSPRFGIVIDTDVAKRAEEMGFNVLVTVVINPADLRFKRTGVWPLRKLKREVEMSMVVNALDLINGTLFLTQLEAEKMDFGVDEVDEEEEIKLEMPEINDKTFSALWRRIVERQVSALKTALRNQPWTGRVLSARGENVIVNAGKRVGLNSGSVFEVFSRGDPIRSASGRSIYLLGPKVGEIRAVGIMEDSAAAVPVTEASYQAGQVIRVKN